MSIYSSERVNNTRFVIRRWLFGSLIFSIPLVMNWLFPHLNIIRQPFLYFYLPLLSLSQLISLFQQDRVNEIAIDSQGRQPHIKYYDVNEGQVARSFSFDRMQIKVSRSKWFSQTKVDSICLFYGKRKSLELSASKDGFAVHTLNNIGKKLEDLTYPLISQ